MNWKSVLKRAALVCGLIVLLFGIGSISPQEKGDKQQGISLVAPPFLSVAHAQDIDMDPTIQNILNEEAGISAYMKSDFEIILNNVRPAFSTIELETNTYILGSIDMPDYPGIYDPHVYVHTDGWIMAYYFRSDPVSKILDTRAATLNSNLLQEAITIIAGSGGIPVSDVAYYDFRYPNATFMMFIAENDADGDTFSIEIPSSYQYFERSWASGIWTSDISFDNIDIDETSEIFDDGYSAYGYLSPTLFSVDVTHTVWVNHYGVIVLVYRVP